MHRRYHLLSPSLKSADMGLLFSVELTPGDLAMLIFLRADIQIESNPITRPVLEALACLCLCAPFPRVGLGLLLARYFVSGSAPADIQ